MNTTIDAPKKRTLSKAAQNLFWVASSSHVLREQFGIEVESTGMGDNLKLLDVPRPWLICHPIHGAELTFDPDKYTLSIEACSTYTRHMRLFILNVWNPDYARSKGWNFDLFRALNGLDQGNRDAVAEFVKFPNFP